MVDERDDLTEEKLAQRANALQILLRKFSKSKKLLSNKLFLIL